MTTTRTSTARRSFGPAAVLALLVGAAILGYGLLLLSTSPLGGVWIAAVGLSLFCSGLFATEWAGDRFGLSARDRRTLSMAFATLAAVLLAAFVVVNDASFASGSSESGG